MLSEDVQENCLKFKETKNISSLFLPITSGTVCPRSNAITRCMVGKDKMKKTHSRRECY